MIKTVNIQFAIYSRICYTCFMAEMLKLRVDFKELQVLKKDFKFKRPSQVIAAVRTTLNDEAFAVMHKARKEIMPRVFNIRNAWVQSSVLVKKAVGRNVRAMQAITGARKKWGRNRGKSFIGLREQEFGAIKRSPDISTLEARGGSIKKRVRPSARYNRLGNIERASEYPGSSPEHRIIVMLRTLADQNFKGGMFIRKSRRFKTGIYKFKGRGRKARTGGILKPIRMIKDLSKSSVRIPAKPWLKTSTKRAITQKVISRFWLRNVRHFTKKTK